MRHHRARIIAAAATVAAFAGPAVPSASASRPIAGGGSGHPIVQASHRSGSSADWLLIAGGSAGVIAVLGTGVAATRRRSHSTMLQQSGLTA